MRNFHCRLEVDMSFILKILKIYTAFDSKTCLLTKTIHDDLFMYSQSTILGVIAILTPYLLCQKIDMLVILKGDTNNRFLNFMNVGRTLNVEGKGGGGT